MFGKMQPTLEATLKEIEQAGLFKRERVLETPQQVRNCIRYVLLNFRRHNSRGGRCALRPQVDAFSSGSTFDAWKEVLAIPPTPEERECVSPAKGELLTRGWRRCGRISLSEVPGPDGKSVRDPRHG